MRLNWDCVRDILLCAEDNTDLRKTCKFVDCGLSDAEAFLRQPGEPPDYQRPLSERYGNDCLIYHVRYCIEAGLLTESSISAPSVYVISDLTPKGHDFAANIHNDKVWKRFKASLQQPGPVSLENVMQTVSALAAAASIVI